VKLTTHFHLVPRSERWSYTFTPPFSYWHFAQLIKLKDNFTFIRVLLENLIVALLVKKFQAFYGTGRFITVLTSPGPYPEPDDSVHTLPSHFFKIYLSIVFPFHLGPLHGGLFRFS
jgi:hypothetical protein